VHQTFPYTELPSFANKPTFGRHDVVKQDSAQITRDYYDIQASMPSAHLFNHYWHELSNSLLVHTTDNGAQLQDAYRRILVGGQSRSN
jgi:hypothetical protein